LRENPGCDTRVEIILKDIYASNPRDIFVTDYEDMIVQF